MGWKLVRDRNEEWSRAHGVSGQWRTAPGPAATLRRKIFEEAAEYAEQWDPAELYDLFDVVVALIPLEDPHGTFGRKHAAKVADMGGFSQLIEWSPVPAGFADWSPADREDDFVQDRHADLDPNADEADDD